MASEVKQGRGVNRIASILDCFDVDEPSHNLSGISARVGLSKSTTHRLLADLVRQGILMREPNGSGYQLGYRLLHWGMVAQTTLGLRNAALPVMQALTKSLGETTILTVRDGAHAMYVEMVESSQPVRLAVQVGQLVQLHAGASSKVLCAFLTQAEFDQILADLELAPVMPGTITDPRQYYAELTAIRRRGYATSFEELAPGAMEIAAPVYDRAYRLVAALAIAAPMTRIPPDRAPELAPQVVEAARELSRNLGALRLRSATQVRARS